MIEGILIFGVALFIGYLAGRSNAVTVELYHFDDNGKVTDYKKTFNNSGVISETIITELGNPQAIEVTFK